MPWVHIDWMHKYSINGFAHHRQNEKLLRRIIFYPWFSHFHQYMCSPCRWSRAPQRRTPDSCRSSAALGHPEHTLFKSTRGHTTQSPPRFNPHWRGLTCDGPQHIVVSAVRDGRWVRDTVPPQVWPIPGRLDHPAAAFAAHKDDSPVVHG